MKLPKPIEDYIRGINEGDAGRMLSSFAKDAVVSDIGRDFRGRSEIKEWAAKEIFAVKVKLEPIRHVERDDEVVVTVKVDGAFDRAGLPDPLLMEHSFTIVEGKIASLTCHLAREPAED
jgi:hypothetical protein